MNDQSAPAARPPRSRWVLILLIGAVLLVAALAVSLQMAARSAATGAPAAADCEEEPPPSSFTLAECEAEGAPAEKPETSSAPN